MTLQTQKSINVSGAIQILKVENRYVIGGYATVKVKDIEDTVGLEKLEEAVHALFADPNSYQNLPVKHGNSEVGKLITQAIDSQGRTWTTNSAQGLFLVGEIDKPKTNRVWEAIVRGELRIFSVAGEAIRSSTPNGGDVITLDKIAVYLDPDESTKFLIIKTIPIDVDKVAREVKDRILKEYPGLMPEDGSLDLDRLSKMSWREVEDFVERRRITSQPVQK